MRFAARLSTATACLLAMTTAACSQAPISGGHHRHRFSLPPLQAATCFGRNADSHSSALVAEVSSLSGGAAQAVVRVKNGAQYAVARFEPRAPGSTGTIDLYVISSRGTRELLETLVAGC